MGLEKFKWNFIITRNDKDMMGQKSFKFVSIFDNIHTLFVPLLATLKRSSISKLQSYIQEPL